ncbi:uncharacterized protein LOC104456359 isoform X1 [Eucalyptus grandis]|uniref:uncharacterized protein LOC104456359 isoform X1 n=2 Tax=Eucalyptus grandis TaxID=71139 RepID=UPI00192EF561|nr:uncharacterized protein LOC104456359 isoform X1 [Eucalyptus grandis]
MDGEEEQPSVMDGEEELEEWETRDSFPLDLPSLEEDKTTTAEELQNWEDGFDLPLDEAMAPDAFFAQEVGTSSSDESEQEVDQELPGRAMADLLLEYAHFAIEWGIPGEKYFHLVKRFLELAVMNFGRQELARMIYDMHILTKSKSAAAAQELQANELGGRLVELIEFAWNQDHTYAGMLRRIIKESRRNITRYELMALLTYMMGFCREK